MPVKEQLKDIATFINRELLPYVGELESSIDTNNSNNSSSLDAEFIVKTSTTSLANEIVADDSSEIDLNYVGNTVSWFLKTGTVALSKLVDLASLSVLGRSSNSSGVMAAISATPASDAVLRESGSVLGFGTVATAGIADDAVTFAKMQNISDQRAIGNDSGSTGSPQEVTIHQELDWIGDDTVWIFDGVDDQVSFGDVLDKERTDSFSISWWYSSIINASQSFITKMTPAASLQGYQTILVGGAPRFEIRNAAANRIAVGTSSTIFADGQLHHVLVTYTGSSDASGVKIYVDGVSQGLTTFNNTLTLTTVHADSLRIGLLQGPQNPVGGVIKHAAIWSRVLTPTEAVEIYGTGTPPNLSTSSCSSALQWWIKLDGTDAIGASGIIDHGPSGFNGTAAGGLSPSGISGSIIGRGVTNWQLIVPTNTGLPLCSNGSLNLPSFQQIGTSGIADNAVTLAKLATQATNTVLANATAGTAVPTALAVGTNTVLGRVAGNIVAASLVDAQVSASAAIALSKLATQNANTVLANATAGSAVPTAVAVGTNTVLGRVAGNIVAATLVDAQVSATAAIAISKLANAAALTVAGNATNGSAAHTDIAATAASGAVLRESGSTIGFGTVAAAGLASAIVSPIKLAVETSNIAAMFSIRVTCTAGVAGAADDVTIYNANAPFAFLILDCLWLDSTAIALSTVQLRDTAGGGGAALSSALTAAVTGTARNNDTQTRAVAANGSVFLRRTDRGVAGEIIIICIRT